MHLIVMECYSVASYRNWLKGICGVFLFNTNCCTIKITDEGCVIDNAVDSKSLSTDSYLYVTTHINIVPKWHKSLRQWHSQTTHNKTGLQLPPDCQERMKERISSVHSRHHRKPSAATGSPTQY